ncbi:MAG: lipid-A-disaccharide synthase [Acidobacteria bacterium]|nr:lipid-A-disaccharide synthase [Acidobacteriota bacterium]MCI0722833.1 lipid-A-disaccharide synthase [Acidobacteriota bacterium]
MNFPPQSVLIVAGEASGDMYAAELVADLLAKVPPNSLRFFGCGGKRMRETGVETLVDIHRLAVLGPFEAVSHLRHLYSALRLLVNEARTKRPRLAILVDFPDFNLRLAAKLKALGIPVVYLISPQVWAWRSGRVEQMKKTIDRMLVILPFEKDFYAERGMEVDYVGHPLVDRVRVSKTKGEFFQAHRLNETVPTVSLLPGSRTKEIQFHLPVLLQAARWLHWQRPVQFLLPSASRLHRGLIRRILAEEGGPPLALIEYDTYNAMGHSDLAVVSSGTATLETALLGTPLITVFKISNLTWIIGQYLVRVPFYSLVNLVAGQELVPELFQSDFTAERLHAEMARLLDQPERLKHVRMGLASVKQRLGAGGAIHNAAERILPWLQDSPLAEGTP